jgi:hypothetical protein
MFLTLWRADVSLMELMPGITYTILPTNDWLTIHTPVKRNDCGGVTRAGSCRTFEGSLASTTLEGGDGKRLELQQDFTTVYTVQTIESGVTSMATAIKP